MNFIEKFKQITCQVFKYNEFASLELA